MLGRRKFLGMLGVGAAAAPLAGQQIISASPATPHFIWVGQALPAAPTDNSIPFSQMARRAFASKETLDAARSALFEDYRLITAIDHDIASKRSFSLAAKVAFQRQRNVDRHIEQMQAEYIGNRLHDLVMKPFKVFG